MLYAYFDEIIGEFQYDISSHHDHKVAHIAIEELLRPDQVNNYKRCEAVPFRSIMIE